MSDSIQRTRVGDFPISQTVTVPASASLIFVSGTLPDLHDASAPAGTPAAYGNTEVQTVSVFNKLRKITLDQPSKPAPTALQVVALPLPGALVEVEAIAARTV